MQTSVKKLNQLCAGDIAAVVGVKDAILVIRFVMKDHALFLKLLIFLLRLFLLLLSLKIKADYEKMVLALRKMMQEDPSFRFSYNEETGQTVISGMGELHLEIIVDRLKREHKVEVVQGKLQVAYKETFKSS